MDRFLGKKVGPYRLVRRLGAGGMGAVYLGLHSAIDSKVAIKILHRRYLGDRDMVRRFIDEARVVNRIDHPGIVRIFDCDSSAELGLCLVMEHLEGQTLLERWNRRRALPTAVVVRILHQVADALAAAHALGIVHRDLKPSNIFLVREPAVAGGWRAKILDFGLAKLLASHRGTATGELMGTLLYMSPEQRLDAKHVDARTDVYSLGVIAYFLLSGRHPFSDQAVLALERGGPSLVAPPLPTSSGVPPELAKIVETALAVDREQRFPSMVALRDALGGLAASMEPADPELDEEPPGGAPPPPPRPRGPGPGGPPPGAPARPPGRGRRAHEDRCRSDRHAHDLLIGLDQLVPHLHGELEGQVGALQGDHRLVHIAGPVEHPSHRGVRLGSTRLDAANQLSERFGEAWPRRLDRPCGRGRCRERCLSDDPIDGHGYRPSSRDR
jgi:serine/threonine-protein kinase